MPPPADPPTQPLRPAGARPPGRSGGWSPTAWVAVVAGALVLGVLVVVVGLAVVDGRPAGGGPDAAPGPATTALGCAVDEVSTCTPVQLGIRFCSAVGPVTRVEVINGNGGPGTVLVVDRYVDAAGEPFSWIAYSGRNVTAEWRLLCDLQARELTLFRAELEELNRAGGSVPPSVAAELAGTTQVPAPGAPPAATAPMAPTAPTADPGASRTSVGGGDPAACRQILTGLLRDVVSGRLTRDGAEARIPDATGTLALRSALDGVDRYTTDGLTRDEAVVEASNAFTYPCGER